MLSKYAIIGGGIALAVTAAWGVRVDSLRAKHLGRLTEVVVVLHKEGFTKSTGGTAAIYVQGLADKTKALKAERDQARTLVDVQSASIAALEEASKEAAAEAEANRKIAAEASRQRDMWIKRARNASTRTERHSAEQEIAECETVLDELYSAGF